MLDKMKGVNPLYHCSDETLLYQAISGLHASVNMHVATNYIDVEKNLSYPNHTMYLNSVGRHEDRIKNLHLLFALVVRSINLVHDQLISNDYTTGLCEDQDQMTAVYITDLLTQTIGECSTSFNEDQFLQDKQVLEEIQNKFYNISRVFDCIGCDKCRLNGKL